MKKLLKEKKNLSIDDTKRYCPIKDNYCNENCIFLCQSKTAKHCLLRDLLMLFNMKLAISVEELKEHRKQEPYKKTFENLHAKEK